MEDQSNNNQESRGLRRATAFVNNMNVSQTLTDIVNDNSEEVRNALPASQHPQVNLHTTNLGKSSTRKRPRDFSK